MQIKASQELDGKKDIKQLDQQTIEGLQIRFCCNACWESVLQHNS